MSNQLDYATPRRRRALNIDLVLWIALAIGVLDLLFIISFVYSVMNSHVTDY